jgi:predicted P-loop ATPase
MSSALDTETQSVGDVNVEPNTSALLDFLMFLQPEGPWAVSAIPCEGGPPEAETFKKGDEERLRGWVQARNAEPRRLNVYFQPNRLRRPLRGKGAKAAKTDVATLDVLHVDLDPRVGEDLDEERARIRALLAERRPEGVPAPSVIVFSGGGFQAFWPLEPALPLDGTVEGADEAARWSQALELTLGADSCHNVDRILRLPGTVNWPNKKKRDRGQVPTLAEVEHLNERRFELADFEKAPRCQPLRASQPAAVVDFTNIERLDDLAVLDQWRVPDRVKVIVAQGHHPDELSSPLKDASRSGWLFDGVCGLVRCGVPDEVIYSVITDPRFGISESVVEKKSRAKSYALRQIARARDAVDGEFVRDGNGKIVARSQHNIRLAISKLGARVEFDEFAGRMLVEGIEGVGPALNDAAMTRLWLSAEAAFQLLPTKEFFWMVVGDAARRNTFHPVCDYLAGLEWDGVARLNDWLVRLAGAQDTEFVRAVGQLFLIAAVRRVRKPGCKFDEMLILESAQGMNKSSAMKVLAVRDDWFGEDLPLTADNKKVVEQTAGKWIIEAAELRGDLKRVDKLKAFLSTGCDRARLSYERLQDDHPRHFVIVGTTNNERYLHDPTGNRRFWPVRVGTFDVEGLRAERDQLWAEAAHREAAGENIRLDPALWDSAAQQQAQREAVDPWEERLSDVFEGRTGKVRIEDIWTLLERPAGQRTQNDNDRLGTVMRRLGYERKKLRIEGEPRWCYARGTDEERKDRIHALPETEPRPF